MENTREKFYVQIFRPATNKWENCNSRYILFDYYRLHNDTDKLSPLDEAVVVYNYLKGHHNDRYRLVRKTVTVLDERIP